MRISDPSAVAVLVRALEDPDEFVRSSAAEALGRIGDPSAVAPLVSALEDQCPLTRVLAAFVLANIAARPSRAQQRLLDS